MKWYLLFSAQPNGGDAESHLAFVAGFRQQVTLLYNCIQSNVTSSLQQAMVFSSSRILGRRLGLMYPKGRQGKQRWVWIQQQSSQQGFWGNSSVEAYPTQRRSCRIWCWLPCWQYSKQDRLAAVISEGSILELNLCFWKLGLRCLFCCRKMNLKEG